MLNSPIMFNPDDRDRTEFRNAMICVVLALIILASIYLVLAP